MWSIANEPASEEAGARRYFEPLFDLARALDPQKRPVTFVTHGEASWDTCEVARSAMSWYSIDTSAGTTRREHRGRGGPAQPRARLLPCSYPNLPIMLGEFGADAVSGLHDSTPTMFSEEFQRDLVAAYCTVLDSKGYIFGECVELRRLRHRRVGQARAREQEGVFTRERNPRRARGT